MVKVTIHSFKRIKVILKVNERLRARWYVQTELKAHEAWARLIMKNRRAAQLMHILVSKIGNENAVIISQKMLSTLMGVKSRKTVVEAVKVLKEDQWIDVIKLEQRGGVNAYVINSNVAWGENRNGLQYALFKANVIVSSDVQPEDVNSKKPLRRFPKIGERQIPIGPGEDPPSEPALPGMEIPLPEAGEPIDIEDYDSETREIKT